MMRGDISKGFLLGFVTCFLLMFYMSYFLECADRLCEQKQQKLQKSTRERSGNKKFLQPSPITISKITEDVKIKSPSMSVKGRELKFKTVTAIPKPSKGLPIPVKQVKPSYWETGNKTKSGPRILCWIMTTYASIMTKAVHVHDTWGQRCDKILYFISNGTEKEPPNKEPTSRDMEELLTNQTVEDNNNNKQDDYVQSDRILPVITFDDIPEGRYHLTAKTMAAFSYVYYNYVNEYDWFLKADDDTYIVMENLRHFLSHQNKDRPYYFGHHFERLYMLNGYNSGGSGYVLSREGLKRFGPNHRKNDKCYLDGQDEDVAFGRCLEAVGVQVGNTADEKGAIRFLCFEMEKHLMGGLPEWTKLVDAYGAKTGINSISPDVISFHYVKPWMMYALEYFIYKFRLRP